MKIKNAKHDSLPTLHSRFFRALVVTGTTMTLVTTLGVGLVDIYTARQSMIENLIHYSEAMARVSAYNIDDPHELTHHLSDFRGLPGLNKSCIYDTEGNLLAYWFKEPHGRCPVFITQVGMQKKLFSLILTRPIMGGNNHYHGMIYVEGVLSEMHIFMVRIGLTTLILLALAVSFCIFISHKTADRISQLLHNLEESVKHLQTDMESTSGIGDPDATEETSRLYRAIIRLRRQLISTMISREEEESKRRWQEGRLSGLLTLLRSRLPEDSALLPCIADHALILQMDSGHAHETTRFDLQEVADKALLTARKIQPPSPELHTIFSLKADMPKQWYGAPSMVEALLRHLLLISFRRTRSGYARLRLEYAPNPHSGDMFIYFTLEDTGTEIHPMQIERWLKESRDERCATHEPLDLSWMILGRIVKALHGDIEVTGASGKGLALQGWVSLQPAEPVSLPQIGLSATVCDIARPLVLIVEDDRVNRQAQSALLKRFGCDVFTVSDGANALEWAPVLPFSLILLDQMLPDTTGTAIARKFYEMIQEHLMPEVPIVALSAADTPQIREVWNSIQVTRILTKPLGEEEVLRLRRELAPADASFFDYASSEITRSMPLSLRARWAEMRGQLQAQLVEFCEQLEGENISFPEIVLAAHAVKSAALTLGYDRLAACLEVIEHHAAPHDPLFSEDNILLALKSLRYFAANDQNPTQLVALSS